MKVVQPREGDWSASLMLLEFPSGTDNHDAAQIKERHHVSTTGSTHSAAEGTFGATSEEIRSEALYLALPCGPYTKAQICAAEVGTDWRRMLTRLWLCSIRTAALCTAAVGLHMMLSLLYSNAATQKNWNTE